MRQDSHLLDEILSASDAVYFLIPLIGGSTLFRFTPIGEPLYSAREWRGEARLVTGIEGYLGSLIVPSHSLAITLPS